MGKGASRREFELLSGTPIRWCGPEGVYVHISAGSLLILSQAVCQAVVEFVTESGTYLVIELGIVSSPNAFSGWVMG
eukprot:6591975-Prymnesium_polylepis.1